MCENSVNFFERKIVESADGSHTILLSGTNETFHSQHGAVQESKHVFIKNGLNMCSKKIIHILEIGFGTGLNAFLTFLEALHNNLTIFYTAIEKYPISIQEAHQLNYPKFLNAKKEDFLEFHNNIWNTEYEIGKNFFLKKINSDILNFSLEEEELFDLIYFDAFSPVNQSELWAEEVFANIYLHTAKGGLLSTYSSKGIVKQNLRNCGFIVKRLKGPPGKHHILNAHKI